MERGLCVHSLELLHHFKVCWSRRYTAISGHATTRLASFDRLLRSVPPCFQRLIQISSTSHQSQSARCHCECDSTTIQAPVLALDCTHDTYSSLLRRRRSRDSFTGRATSNTGFFPHPRSSTRVRQRCGVDVCQGVRNWNRVWIWEWDFTMHVMSRLGMGCGDVVKGISRSDFI